MRSPVIAYLVTLLVFCGLDFIWLSFAAERLYRPALADLLGPRYQAAPAVVFYLIAAGGLVFLAIRPAAGWRQATVNGAVFGLCAYATYDLTNLATLRGWPLPLSLVDLAWGTLLSAIAATCGYLASTAGRARPKRADA